MTSEEIVDSLLSKFGPIKKSIKLTASDEVLEKSFLSLKSPRELAALLEVKYSKLVFYTITNASVNYETFSIPKRSGGQRIISAPVTPLKIIQRKLNQILLSVYKTKFPVHGFVRGRSIKTNAAPHLRKRLVLNLDLNDFFGQINFGRVRGMFIKEPFNLPPNVATVIAQICCSDNRLPQGAPTSPIVSNMICRSLDYKIQYFAHRRSCAYTRYADDLTLSTNRREMPRSIATVEYGDTERTTTIAKELNSIIEEEGFSINQKKVRLRTKSQRQEVTGLIVNEKLNVQRDFIRNIRAMLYAWKKFGLVKAAEKHITILPKNYQSKNIPATPERKANLFRRRIRGKLEHLKAIRGDNYSPYRTLLQKYIDLNPDTKLSVPSSAGLASDLHPIMEQIKDYIWVIQDCHDGANGEIIEEEGTAFMLEGIGLVTCDHTVHGETTIVIPAANYTKSFRVRKVYSDPRLDLAVLHFEDESEACQKFSPKCSIEELYRGLHSHLKARVEPGEEIYICGFLTYHSGDLPVLVPGFLTGTKNRSMVKRLLVSAFIESGMSGGPMVNKKGEVLGVAVTGVQTRKPVSEDDSSSREAHASVDSNEDNLAAKRLFGIYTLFSAKKQAKVRAELVKDISSGVSSLLKVEIKKNVKETIKKYRLVSSMIEQTNERAVIAIDDLISNLPKDFSFRTKL